MTAGSRRALPCPACGALNGADFERCVRCGAGLSTGTATLDRLGAHIDGAPHRATTLIAGLTLVVYALQCASAIARDAGSPLAMLFSGGMPRDALRFGALDVRLLDEPFRLVSAMFVHFGALHIVFNMLMFVDLGRMAEPLVGTARFAIAYVASGIAGFALAAGWAIFNHEPLLVAGASGAVLGVMGLLLGIAIRRRHPRWKDFAVRAVFYGVIFGVLANMANAGFRVSVSAHVGGLGAGTLLGLAFGGRRPRSDLAVNLGALVAILACFLALVLAVRSPVNRAPTRRALAPTSPSITTLASTSERARDLPPALRTTPARPALEQSNTSV